MTRPPVTPDPYPRHPWLAAFLALLSPIGLLYTSNLLSLLGFLIGATLLIFLPANVMVRIVLLLLLAVTSYLWVTRRPYLSLSPALTRFDRPSWPKAIGLSAAILGLIFVMTRFIVTTVSTTGFPMVPTIKAGEKVTVNLLPSARKLISHGTVVVYQHPKRHQRAISRVVALPGDIVELKDALLYVNGKPADDPQRINTLKQANCFDAKLELNNEVALNGKKTLHIPEGTVYLLADNRSEPFEDSRVYGPLPIRNIAGIVSLNGKGNAPLAHADCRHDSIY